MVFLIVGGSCEFPNYRMKPGIRHKLVLPECKVYRKITQTGRFANDLHTKLHAMMFCNGGCKGK
jgi:hypothetical protein